MTIKRKLVCALAALALLPATRGVMMLAALAAPTVKPAAAHAVQSPVHLLLSAERRRVTRDAQGQPQESWQAVSDKAAVAPGETLRYTLRVENAGPRPIRNLALTQPVPPRTTYALSSVGIDGADGVQAAFRVDGESAFQAAPTGAVAQPDGTIARVPAPAEAYRALRWTFGQSLAPAQIARITYQIKVR